MRSANTIAGLGGVDSCYGGIGIHGHVAFNEPPISRFYQVTLEEFRQSRTRVLPLAPETMVMNSIRRMGGNFYTFPPMAITIGMKDILESRRIRLYCDGGDWQKAILRISLLGEVSTDYPATLLQDHPNAMITADAETAAPLVTHRNGCSTLALTDALRCSANAAALSGASFRRCPGFSATFQVTARP